MAELTRTMLQCFFLIHVRKEEGVGRDPGHANWYYRVECKCCKCKSPESWSSVRKMPKETFEWAEKHHECKKKGRKKPRPG